MSDDGFLQRWSKRKSLQRDNAPDSPQEPSLTSPPLAPMPPAERKAQDGGPPNAALQERTAPSTDGQPTQGHATPKPPPSLADTQALTPESDFRPFMGQGVTPEVKNAAMKKLFADPHFNVMDRMDIYIDDYSQPDPLPLAMLRQMNGAKFLNLFEDEEKAELEAVTKPEGTQSPTVQANPEGALTDTDAPSQLSANEAHASQATPKPAAVHKPEPKA